MSQFAEDSMSPAPISVNRDAMGHEMPVDRPMHEECTPGMGAMDFDCGQYNNDLKGKK